MTYGATRRTTGLAPIPSGDRDQVRWRRPRGARRWRRAASPPPAPGGAARGRRAGWPACCCRRPAAAGTSPPGCRRARVASPRWWAIEETVTTRGAAAASSAGSSRAGEREVAEVVGAVLQLEAVLGLAVARRRHHPGVVDQQVERARPSARRSSRTDACEARSSRSTRVEPAIAGGGPPPGLDVAAGQHDGGAVGGELPGGVHADPGVGAGHDGGASGQVGQVGGLPAQVLLGSVGRVGRSRSVGDPAQTVVWPACPLLRRWATRSPRRS